jgi:hypothetical protein
MNMTSLEAFLMMMLLDELDLILKLTNKILESSGKKELSFQELLCWFGVTLLMSASNFRGDCRTHLLGKFSLAWKCQASMDCTYWHGRWQSSARLRDGPQCSAVIANKLLSCHPTTNATFGLAPNVQTYNA